MDLARKKNCLLWALDGSRHRTHTKPLQWLDYIDKVEKKKEAHNLKIKEAYIWDLIPFAVACAQQEIQFVDFKSRKYLVRHLLGVKAGSLQEECGAFLVYVIRWCLQTDNPCHLPGLVKKVSKIFDKKELGSALIRLHDLMEKGKNLEEVWNLMVSEYPSEVQQVVLPVVALYYLKAIPSYCGSLMISQGYSPVIVEAMAGAMHPTIKPTTTTVTENFANKCLEIGLPKF